MNVDDLKKRVAELVAEEDGFWRSCSGCYETEDGYAVGYYPHSAALGCTLGSGCGECGGIGAIWDSTDYADMGRWMLEEDRKRERRKAQRVELQRYVDRGRGSIPLSVIRATIALLVEVDE